MLKCFIEKYNRKIMGFVYVESCFWVVAFSNSVMEFVWKGVNANYTKALFILGDKPKFFYPQVKEETCVNIIFIVLHLTSKFNKE